MKIIVPLATGFEETEAIAVIDVLRRAAFDVVTVAVDHIQVKSAHDVTVLADTTFNEINLDEFSAIFLPGGGPGTANLKKSRQVLRAIQEIDAKGGYLAAICAAPTVLAEAGVLTNKRVTCFPGNESSLGDATYIPSPVVVDGKVITGKGVGASLSFALKIVEIIKGGELSNKLRSQMQIYWDEPVAN